VAKRSPRHRRAVSGVNRNGAAGRAIRPAQGRLDHGPPVAVIDIGSNSVRLVIYEGVVRSPTPLFNEKVLAGLGREVQTRGLMPADAVQTALAALRRFRALCDVMAVRRVWVVATAACRDARNGADFIAMAERICRTRIDVLSGGREARLTALGVLSGFHKPDGIVGDLGATSASARRPAAICARRSPPASSAKISTSASASPRSKCPRCAIDRKRSRTTSSARSSAPTSRSRRTRR
jgi:exopolyphosphatase/guanosine-5'-triphosphate,3'-diphosphate pyrophosphatase